MAALLLLGLAARRAPGGGRPFVLLSAAVWMLVGWAAVTAAQRPRVADLVSAAPGTARVFLDHPVLAEMQVLGADRVQGDTRLADVRLLSVSRGAARRPAGDHVRLYLPPHGPRLLEGDSLRAWVTLRRRQPFANGAPVPRLDPPLSGRLKSAALIEAHLPGGPGARRMLAQGRRFLLARLDAGLARGGASPRVRSLAAAVILGERGAVSPDDRRRLADGGAAHVLAVSGLHMTAVIGLLATALQRAGLGPRKAAVVVVMILPAYALLLPLRPSVARAALMGLCLPAARLLGRGAAPLNLLGGAGVVLLAWRPGLSRDAGFALSFAVTAALIHLAGLGPKVGPRRSRLARLRRLLVASTVATAAGIPLTAYFFGRATPGAVAANLVAVPAAAVLVGCCALATLLAAVHPLLAAPAGPLAGLAVEILFAAADWPPQLPGGHLLLPPGRPGLILASLAVLFASRRQDGTWRPVLLLAAVAAQGLVLGGCLPPAPLPRDALTLRALDVGQGDALLVGLPDGEAILVDGGGLAGTDLDLGRRVVLPSLHAAGVRRLAAVALSHAHHDHGYGLLAVLEEMPVEELWLGGIAPGDDLTAALVDRAVAAGIAIRVLRRGDRLHRGGAMVLCLSPGGDRRRAGPNDRSLVLRVEAEHGALLLPGDLEAAGEAALANAGLAPVEVLKVPHHGSASSSTQAFLDAVRPRVAVISVSRANPWGHPDPQVLERLEACGASILRTDQRGAVTVALTPRGLRWWTIRPQEP